MMMVETGPGDWAVGDWAVIHTLRRLVGAPRCRGGAPVTAETGTSRGAAAGLERAERLFRAYLADVRRSCVGVREPVLAGPGSPALTKDERRLLRALAAARAGNEALMDNYLYKLALAPAPRARLAAAVRALARPAQAEDRSGPAPSPYRAAYRFTAPGADGCLRRADQETGVPA